MTGLADELERVFNRTRTTQHIAVDAGLVQDILTALRTTEAPADVAETVAPQVAARQLLGLYYELQGMDQAAQEVRSPDWGALSSAGERLMLATLATLVETVRKEQAAVITRLSADLAEVRKVIEPFAKIAEHDIGSDEADADRFSIMSSKNARGPTPTVGMFRAAHQWWLSQQGDQSS